MFVCVTCDVMLHMLGVSDGVHGTPAILQTEEVCFPESGIIIKMGKYSKRFFFNFLSELMLFIFISYFE